MSKVLIVFCLLGFSAVTKAGQCESQRKAKHEAKKDFHRCSSGWIHENKKKPLPADDCQAKWGAFVQAAKDLATCRAN